MCDAECHREWVRLVVDGAPPLSQDQRQILRPILAGSLVPVPQTTAPPAIEPKAA